MKTVRVPSGTVHLNNTTMETIKNSLSELKRLLRENDVAGDPWAVVMGAWFDCAAHLYEKGDCPVEWRYRPGCGGNVIDQESVYFDLFDQMDSEQLTEAGQYLWRLTEALKRAGRDY